MTVLILVLLVLILLELTQQLPLQCSCGVFLCNLIDMSMTGGDLFSCQEHCILHFFVYSHCFQTCDRNSEGKLVVTMAYSHFRELMKSVG